MSDDKLGAFNLDRSSGRMRGIFGSGDDFCGEMTMNLWYWIIAEFRALGWYCVYHGPEFWLVVPLGAGLLVLSVIVLKDILRGGRK